MPLFNAYCKSCHETLSYWPEFVLPYQREPLEIHEQVAVEHLDGRAIRESAREIGYDPRTLARWLRRIFAQAEVLCGKVVRRILYLVGTETIPLPSMVAEEPTALLFAWVYRLAQLTDFQHKGRLIGLCNCIG